MEDKEGRADQAYRGGAMIPAQMRAEVKGGKDAEDRQRDDLLNHFELDHAEAAVAKAVGWNLEAILKEGDAPADEDDLPEGVLTEFQVAVPGNGHEDVGEDEQDYCPHIRYGCA